MTQAVSFERTGLVTSGSGQKARKVLLARSRFSAWAEATGDPYRYSRG